MDDNQKKALNEEGANLDTTPVAEQAPEEVKDNREASQESTTETGGEPKKGADGRIRELNQRAKAAEEETKSLKQKLEELTSPVGNQGQQQTASQYNPQEPIVAPGEEIDVNELNRRIGEREQRILQTADSRAELRQRQSEAINRINSEASRVVDKFPQLNPESDSFDRELSETVTEAVEAYVKSNPYSASVEKFTSRLMSSLAGAAQREAGQATENIAKQVSGAALRPNSVRQPEKAAKDKTIAELEADLGIVIS